MLDISSARVKRLIVHRIGNKLREEGVQLSHEDTGRSQSVDDLILRHYLSSGTQAGDSYEFCHESDINLNVVRHYCSLIFESNDTFEMHSGSIGKHLYSCSVHPNIVGGELIVCLFDDVRVANDSSQAIGIFRIEKKAHYIDTQDRDGDIEVFERTGISLDRIQKGAIVFSDNTNVKIVDTLSAKTKYWIDTFLKVVPSAESKLCERATVSLLRGVNKKVDDPNQSFAFGAALRNVVSSKGVVSVADIVSISEKYIGRESVDATMEKVKADVGRELPATLSFDAKRLRKVAREFMFKTEVCDGVHIVISKNSATLINLEVDRQGKSIRALLNISLEG